MTSISMDTNVAALVRRHERSVERHAGVTAWLGGGLARLSADLAAWAGSLVFGAQARWMHDQAVWFQGAAARIDASDRADPLDPDWKLIDRLHTLERRLADLQSMFIALGGTRPRKLAARMLAALSELHESVRDLRGSIQAYEADRCAALAADQRVESAEALERALRELRA